MAGHILSYVVLMFIEGVCIPFIYPLRACQGL